MSKKVTKMARKTRSCHVRASQPKDTYASLPEQQGATNGKRPLTISQVHEPRALQHHKKDRGTEWLANSIH